MERLTINMPTGAALKCSPYSEQEAKEQFMGAINKLAAYEDAAEQGRLVVLPCKAGDFIYQLEETGIVRRWIETIEVFEDGIFLHIGRGGCPNIDTFGKTVFLTREAAEAALNKKG